MAVGERWASVSESSQFRPETELIDVYPAYLVGKAIGRLHLDFPGLASPSRLGPVMRFAFPLLPAEFEIPDEWWAEAGMIGFTPTTLAYRSTEADAQTIPLREVVPPFRLPEYPLDYHGFARARMTRILRGIVTGASIPAVPVAQLPQADRSPSTFCYCVRNGLHRFYASIAAGFERLPVKIS